MICRNFTDMGQQAHEELELGVHDEWLIENAHLWRIAFILLISAGEFYFVQINRVPFDLAHIK